MKKDIIADMAEDSITAVVKPMPGILVEHTLNRLVPRETPAYYDQFGWLDHFAQGSLETGVPVAVLHTSADGAWRYIRSEFMYGWVPSRAVALAPPREVRSLTEPDKFIVALSHKISVFADRERTSIISEAYQGTRLVLTGRSAEGFRVLMPFRKPDGTLMAAEGWVAPDADVSVGWQPFTQANVIRTMFRLLGRPYGWHDSWHERDCCGVIRTVFRTFGIIVPRGTIHELHSSDHVICFAKETPKDVKYRQLESCEPGITVCGFTGHVMIYLGKVNVPTSSLTPTVTATMRRWHGMKISRVGVCVRDEGGSFIGDWTELATSSQR